MRFPRSLTPALLMAVSLSLASGCTSREHVTPIFPPAADLAVEAKPVLDPATLDSEAALDAHDIALETLGRTRLGGCGEGVSLGVGQRARMPVTCPPPPEPG